MAGTTIMGIKEVAEESLKEAFRGSKIKEIKCPYCNYAGEDLSIGRKPLSNPMACSKCNRPFNPFSNSEIAEARGFEDSNGDFHVTEITDKTGRKKK